MQPLYLGEGHGAIFAWYHPDKWGQTPIAGELGSDPIYPRTVAVICPPLGHEYTRTHRSMRHLAERLARRGVPALRFDYHGVGDSPGADLDPARFARWRADVGTAISHAKRLSGCERVCLIGVRLGGMLAALAAEETPVDLLVLWNAPVKGRAYVRELQAIAQAAAQGLSAEGVIESAGCAMTAETARAITAVDLPQCTPRVSTRALIATRDDAAADPALAARFAALGIAADEVSLPGWSGMTAEHQFTIVPGEALDTIADWVARHAPRGRCAFGGDIAPRDAIAFEFSDPAGDVEATLEERLCRFGADGHLFGVLTRVDGDPRRPAVLLPNGGSVHRVGPNRLYVTLARSLAAMGFACLRFDIEGIGDSVLRGAGRENHPYQPAATADTRAALEFLAKGHGYSRFVVMGLCSGAHTAFHLGLEAPDLPFEIAMINPYTFYWREGMSLATAEHFADIQAYRKSMRDPSRWMKLLRGDVNFRRLVEVGVEHSRSLARSHYDALCETILPSRAPRLSRDLRRLIAAQRRLAIFVSEGDPGADLLRAGARLTAERAVGSGDLRLETIPGADHTFSRLAPRLHLIARLREHLGHLLPELETLRRAA